MASFTAQAALRAKWSSLVEEHTIEVPPEVTSKVTSVVGWLKQAIAIKIATSPSVSVSNITYYDPTPYHYPNFIKICAAVTEIRRLEKRQQIDRQTDGNE
ncbi:unnamed protein product [Callosobruchus maculatus]|uniref:Uncharacterized protein n=1 Tax=Callosobruchus maculatus TaxID=64391 RepID=A0A653DBS8_CALMS|nr:unnamed protein product [Callosobruchus maculatus]